MDRKRQLHRKFVDYYSRSFGFARINSTRVLVDDVGHLCDRPGGSRMAVNSRILRVHQSFLLEDVLALVSWEDDVNRLASVQTGSDAGSRATGTSPRVWQTAFHVPIVREKSSEQKKS